MTISTSTVKNVYVADGVNREWQYTFPVNDLGNVCLAVEDEAGAQTEPATGLTVRLGAVTYPDPDSGLDPVRAGCKIILYRATPAVQELDLYPQGAFDAEALEKALDKLTMLAQEVQERLTRTVQVGITDEGEPTVENLIGSMRALYSDIKQTAVLAGQEAQKAIEAAVRAYEQAEKLYSKREHYQAGTDNGNYTGDLQTFHLVGAYKCDNRTLKVFVDGNLKEPDADYSEVPDPALTQKGDEWGNVVFFTVPLPAGTKVTFIWGDTLTLPGGEVAEQAALAAQRAGQSAQAAGESAALAQERANTFFTYPVGAIYYSQSDKREDNPAAVPVWRGEVLEHFSTDEAYKELYAFIKKHPELCQLQEEYDAILAREKHVNFYVWDKELDTLRLPRYTRAIMGVQEDSQRGAYRYQVKDHRHITCADDAPGPYGNMNKSYSGGGGGYFGGGYDERVKTGGAEKAKSDTEDLLVGAEPWPAHAREYPWLVIKSNIDHLKKASGGVFKFWFGTEEEFAALADVPDTQLSFIPEQDL